VLLNLREAKKITKEILSHLGEDNFEIRQEDGIFFIEVFPKEKAGLLIGKEGETLYALQYILGLVLGKRASSGKEVAYPKIVLDIAGYKKQQEEQLQAFVQSACGQVLETGLPMRLRPMNARERRIAHMVAAETKGVESESEGEGRERRVVIKPE